MSRELMSARCICDTHFVGRGGHRGSTMVPFERAVVVSYRLPIVTIALSLTIQPQFAVESLPMLKSTGVSLEQNLARK